MKKLYSALIAISAISFCANAATNMAYQKQGRTETYQLNEERVIVSDRVLNPNEAVKGQKPASASYSVGTWVNLDKYMSLTGLNNSMVVMSYTPSHHLNTNGVWVVYVNSNGELCVNGYDNIGTQTNKTVELNTWNHIMFVYDAEATKYQVYLNGELAAEKALAAGFQWLDENPVFSFAGWEFSGMLDEAQFYNKALTAEEVAKAQKSAKKVDGLTALYTFDEIATGTDGQFANQAKGGENYNMVKQTIAVPSKSSYYIWDSGIAYVTTSSEGAGRCTVAETTPDLVEGREINETYLINFSATEGGVIAVSTDYDFINEVENGSELNASDLTDGLYVEIYTAMDYQLESLMVNGEDVTDEVDEFSTYHLATVDDDVTIMAVFSAKLAGIEEVGIDFQSGEVEYFNLQGVRVAADNLTSGIYVARQGEKAAKVLIKK